MRRWSLVPCVVGRAMNPLVSTSTSVHAGVRPAVTPAGAAASEARGGLELTLRGRPPAGVYTGSLTRDAATGRVIFPATQLKLVVPPDAAGHLPVPVGAVVRIPP
ncbi:MAG: hypothetical protein ACLFTL_01955, partial [Alphaproteobacteria bacterium]